MLCVILTGGTVHCIFPFNHFLFRETFKTVTQIRHVLLLFFLLFGIAFFIGRMRAHSKLNEMICENSSTPVNEHIERMLDLKLSQIEIRGHNTPPTTYFLAHPTAGPLIVVQSD